MEPPIKGPPRRGQPLNKGCSFGPLSRERDNLSIKDKVADPKVSFTQRFHCSVNNRDGLPWLKFLSTHIM